MLKKESSVKVTKFNIFNYSTADAEFIIKNSKSKKAGLPLYWPTKDDKGRKIILSFVNARIFDKQGKLIDDEVANFDIFDNDKFDRNAPDAITKIKFIDALLSPNVLVKGGIYYKGKFLINKIGSSKSIFLTQSFFNDYFSLEDGDLIIKYFGDNQEGNFPFWPTYSKTNKMPAIFSAVNAYIYERNSDTPINDKPYNFDLFMSHKFNLENKEDAAKIEVIRALLRSDRVVKGFYYKGKHIPSTITEEFKQYLEKGFVKKNFVIEQKDFLLGAFSKDPKSGNLLFYPSTNKKGRPIAISVIGAMFPDYDSKYSTFDVYTDEPFDLTKPEFQKKLDIISGISHKKEGYSGILYFDSILIPGICTKEEIYYRRTKVEKELNIYITENPNFLRMNKKHTIKDRDTLLNLCNIYDNCYPNSKIEVEKKDKEFLKEPYFLKVDRINVIDNEGNYLYKNNASFKVNTKEEISNAQIATLVDILKYLNNKSFKVRGGLYINGKNNLKANINSLLKNFEGILSEDDKKAILDFANEKFDNYDIDKASGMLTNWPVYDENGRNVLLSVVESNVFFKVGKNVVKATVNGNFDIYEGETFGLVGESGSGKTTISRAILRINPLTKGGIYFKGRLISSKLPKTHLMSIKKNIQMIFQDPAACLNERANVDYIVSEGLYNFHMFKSNEERLNKVENMLHQVGLLNEHMSRYPHEFSGGQRQRIGIARALVIEPQLVLADEPISALDVSIRAQVLNLLKNLQKEKKLTYLFIAHDLSIIRYISDRIAVMHQGHIVEVGPAEEIYSQPLHPYTRSLLTAIPQPDPRTKNNRKKIPYEKTTDYDTCRWVEFKNKHFVLVDDNLEKEIKGIIK